MTDEPGGPKMKSQKKSVHKMTDEPSGHTEFFVEVVHAGDDDGDWMIDLEVNDRKLRFKLDTGAQCNMLFHKLYKRSWEP